MKGKKRFVLWLLPLFLVALAAAPAIAQILVQCPGGDANDDTYSDTDPTIRCIHLGGGDGFVNMADKNTVSPDGTLVYMFGFVRIPNNLPANQVMEFGELAAQFPAPTIKVKEGEKLYLTLTTIGMKMRPDLFDPHTVHYHGFPNAGYIFDGEPMASLAINTGASFTYFYNLVEPGTFMYHCHVEATEHMQMGMLGNLYVTPKQDGIPKLFQGRTYTKFAYNDGDGSTGYDVDYPIQITGFDPVFHENNLYVQPLPFADMKDKYMMLNGRGYPDTINPAVFYNTFSDLPSGGKPSQPIHSIITAQKGQRILLRISSLSTVHISTLASFGIPMRVVGKDAKHLRGTTGQNLHYNTNSVTLGGGQSVDVILDTKDVAPGTYFLYSRNLWELSNDKEDFGGMMTEITITP
jgi:FtsP/CotA-like multicopper oxidase with cupredoxin domain